MPYTVPVPWHALGSRYFRGAHVLLIVFDVTNHNSFTSISSWQHLADLYAALDVPMVVVGNKTDRVEDRVVSHEEAQAFCDAHQLPYFETSAQSGAGVPAVFDAVARLAALRVGKRYRELGGTAHLPGVGKRKPAATADAAGVPRVARLPATRAVATVRTFRSRTCVRVT